MVGMLSYFERENPIYFVPNPSPPTLYWSGQIYGIVSGEGFLLRTYYYCLSGATWEKLVAKINHLQACNIVW